MSIRQKIGNEPYARLLFIMEVNLNDAEFRMFTELEKHSVSRPVHKMKCSVLQKVLIELAQQRKKNGAMSAAELASMIR